MNSVRFIKNRVSKGATALAFLMTLAGANLAPLTSFAAADVCTWAGTTNADWSTGTNWTGCDNGGVPEDGDTLVFPIGAANISMNQDIAGLDPASLSFTGDGYTLSGLALGGLGSIAFSGTGNTVDTDLTFTGATAPNAKGAGTNTISGDIAYSVAGDVTWSGGGTLALSGAQSGSIGGAEILPAGALNVSGGGTQTVAGGVQISGGTLGCQSSTCLGDSSNAAVQAGSGQLLLGSVTLANPVTINSGSGLVVGAGATATLSGLTTVAGVSTESLGAGSTLNHTGGLAVNAGLTVSGAGLGSVWNYNGGGITGAGSISCMTADCMFTAGSPAYTGLISAMSNSLVEADSASSLGSAVSGTTVNAGASLNLTGGAKTIAEPLTIAGTGLGGSYNGAIVSNGSGAHVLSGPVTLGASSTVSKVTTSGLNFSGVIAGTGNLTFLGNGNGGVTTLSGGSSNSYAGSTVVNSAVLNLNKNAGLNAVMGDLTVTGGGEVTTSNDEQIPDSSAVNLSGALSELSIGAGLVEKVTTLMGDGTVTLTNGSSNLVFTSGDYSGVPTGAGIFTKAGTGTSTVTGTSAHTGSTNVSDGVFVVNGNYSSAPLNLQGGTLKGNGTLGTVNATGGKVAPGNSPGRLTVTTISMNAATTFEEEINGPAAGTEYDQLIATGAVNLGGATLTIVLSPSYVPAGGSVFTIITAGSVTGTFAGLADGSVVRVNGLAFRVNYTATTVTLTYVPDPLVNTGADAMIPAVASLALMTVAGALMFGKRKAHQAISLQ